MNQMNQDELIQKFQAADQNALAEYFDSVRDRLFSLIRVRLDTRLRTRVDPTDVLQEAFIDCSVRLPGFMEKSLSPYLWIRLVVTERILDFHRKHLYAKKRSVRREMTPGNRLPIADASSISLASLLVGEQTSVASRAVTHEREQQLATQLDELEKMDREIILLRSFEQLSNDEAADVLGISKYAASKRFVRALSRLQKLLEKVPGFHSLAGQT